MIAVRVFLPLAEAQAAISRRPADFRMKERRFSSVKVSCSLFSFA
jgi:hypothetical protein